MNWATIPDHYKLIREAVLRMRRERGSVRITHKELKNATLHSYDQIVLSILKEYGAPVEGIFQLAPILDGYEWNRVEDPDFEGGGFVISWRKLVTVENPTALDNSSTTKGD